MTDVQRRHPAGARAATPVAEPDPAVGVPAATVWGATALLLGAAAVRAWTLPVPFSPAEAAAVGMTAAFSDLLAAPPNGLPGGPLFASLLASVVTTLIPAAWGLADASLVVLLRLAGAVAAAPLPLLCYVAARRLRAPQAAAVAAAYVPAAAAAAVPAAGAFGPHWLAATLIVGLCVAVIRVARGELSTATAVVAGLLAGGLALTVTPGLAGAAAVAVAYAVAAVRRAGPLVAHRSLLAVGVAAWAGLAHAPWGPGAGPVRMVWWAGAVALAVGGLLRARPRLATLRVPAAVWLATALHAVLLIVWAVVVPPWQAPDEPMHADAVVVAGRTDGWPEPASRRVTRRITDSYPVFDSPRLREPATPAHEIPDRDARPRFDQVGPEVPSQEFSHLSQHPPLAFLMTSAALRSVRALVPGAAWWSFDEVLVCGRLLNAALLVPLPLLAFACARRWLGPGPRAYPVAVCAALVPLGIPRLTSIGSKLNNDNLLTLLIGVLLLLLIGVMRGDRSRRTALQVGVVSAAALLVKGFALFVPGWVAGAYLLAARRYRMSAWGPLALAEAVALGGAGWWWLRNVIVYRDIQPSGIGPLPPEDGVLLGFWPWAREFAERYITSSWVGRVPPESWDAAWLAAAVTTTAIAVAVWRHRDRMLDLGEFALLLMPTVAITAFTVYGSRHAHTVTTGFHAMHGRYAFPGLIGLALVALTGAVLGRPRASRWVPLGLLGWAVLLQLDSLRVQIGEFWGSPAPWDPVDAVRAWLAWTPLPPPILVAAVVGAAALTGVLGARLAQSPFHTARSRPNTVASSSL